MIRYGRRNAVVPIMERIVEDDLISESDEERLIHFPFGFIHLVHNLSKDFQTFLCHGICSPAAGISDGEVWSSAPRAGYLGEEAVFNGVELGAVGRVVHDEDPHAKAVGKIHEVLLEDTVSAGVGTPALHAIKCLLSRSLSVVRYSISALLILTGGFFFIIVMTWKSITKTRRFLQFLYI